MRVQHNIAAMNAYRNFSTNNSKLNKNLEKLSTGYKINRAGDDAAGLAISEKMRAQISGIEGATKNSKDGISLIQTAEGALTEVHDMLNRMTTLAEQSANGTYDDEVDRNQLQKEVEALKSEINRIADSTNYNGMKLLNGELDSSVDTKNVDTTEWTAASTDLLAANVASNAVVGTGTIFHQGTTQAAVSGEFSVNLNNLSPSFNISDTNERDTVSITIGKGVAANPAGVADSGKVSQTLSVTAKEIAAQEGDSDAERVAKAFVAKYGKEGTEAQKPGNTGNPGITVYDSYDSDDDGTDDAVSAEHFDISLGDDGVSLKFTQTTAPTDQANVVDTRLQVQVETTNYGVDSTRTGGTPDLGLSINNWKLEDGIDAATAKALNDALAAGASLSFTFNGAGTATDSLDEGDKLVTAWDDANTTGFELKYKDSNGNWVGADTDMVYKDTLGANGDLQLTGGSGPSQIEFQFVKTGETNAVATFKLDLSQIANTSVANQNDNGGVTTFTLKSTNDTSSSLADYNAATTVISEPTVASAARLASTYIDADKLYDKVQDGHQIKIGDTAYTFAVGGDSKVDTDGENVVNLKDLDVNANGRLNNTGDIKVALQRLTEKAKGNEMYSVGFDENITGGGGSNGALTLTENVTYSGDADLTTKEGIAKTIQFSEGAKTTINEDGIKGKALTLQIGDTSDSFNKMSVDIKDMHADSIGIGDVDISTQEGASKALDSIKNAVNVVSDVRGSLGALQNRLDHTINNLGVMRENIQNAESLIRDTDVAEEMMTYTKNNILNQSAQAMLAQANQLPQGVLQLLG